MIVSICIPAFKRPDFLKRLLDSICIQRFQDFEVIVTDDSPDQSVKKICQYYEDKISIFYYQNQPSLGTPENWNEAVRRAKGKWIKIMHDDDWFKDENALYSFVKSVKLHPESSFVFSAYKNISSSNYGKEVFISTTSFRYKMLLKNPATLFSRNIIGPPSCVMYKKEPGIDFDNRLKWLVDIDFYINYLSINKPVYINANLINIGISDSQVTNTTFRNKQIEIPESFLLLEKYGTEILNNLLVFDAWWRLIRNLRIRNVEDIREAGYAGNIPKKILMIIRIQSKISVKYLSSPFISKSAMFIAFLTNG
jgi:glycosyltransferase involved in cell wall biosynthesis